MSESNCGICGAVAHSSRQMGETDTRLAKEVGSALLCNHNATILGGRELATSEAGAELREVLRGVAGDEVPS